MPEESVEWAEKPCQSWSQDEVLCRPDSEQVTVHGRMSGSCRLMSSLDDTLGRAAIGKSSAELGYCFPGGEALTPWWWNEHPGSQLGASYTGVVSLQKFIDLYTHDTSTLCMLLFIGKVF